jgi:arabinoxylan arabinofuranohydrolase
MQTITAVRLFVLPGIFLFPLLSSADNCFITARPTSEAAPMVFTWDNEERLYVYCTQDIINGSGVYPVDTIHCYSTTDMFHWKDEGVCLSEQDIPWAVHTTHKLWAAHVAGFTITTPVPGKDSTGNDIQALKDTVIYRLVAAEDSSDDYFHIFTAQSYTPAGPYIAGPPIPGMVRNVIDPFIFVDPSDASVWMSYRHQNTRGLGFVRMDDSASSITGDVNNALVNVGSDAPSGYMEGSSMFKRGDCFFLVYSLAPGSENEMIAYSTAKSRSGPWTYRGTIMASNPSEYTIHAGVCDFKGQWYLFYHNVTFGGSIFGTSRCAAVEYLYFTNDSTIDTSRISKTNRGVGIPKAVSDTIEVDRGVISRALSRPVPYNSTSTEETGWYVDSINNGSVVRYDSVDFTPTPGNSISSVFARIAGGDTAATIDVHLDSAAGTLIATIPIDSAGSLAKWKTIDSVPLVATPSPGIHNLVLVFKTAIPKTYTLNWIGFHEGPSGAIKTTGKYPSASQFNCRWISKTRLNCSGLHNALTARIRIFNLAGQEIAHAANIQRLDAHAATITLTPGRLSAGVYLVSIVESNRNFALRVNVGP